MQPPQMAAPPITNPIEDHGFMYTRDLADPDGHALGAMWMEMSAIPAGYTAA
jgi:predicted lactoylglutathione lyase